MFLTVTFVAFTIGVSPTVTTMAGLVVRLFALRIMYANVLLLTVQIVFNFHSSGTVGGRHFRDSRHGAYGAGPLYFLRGLWPGELQRFWLVLAHSAVRFGLPWCCLSGRRSR